MKLYKVLDKHRAPYWGGTGKWPPAGKWLTVEGSLKPCEKGIHLCRRADLVNWLGPTIWEAEADLTDHLEAPDKVVVRRARLVRELSTWNECTATLFAADCAERVVHSTGPDERLSSSYTSCSRLCPRLHLFLPTVPSLEDAARATAYVAARAAAYVAADAAAYVAADAAASAAAWSAERAWQTERLFYYLDGGNPNGDGA